MFTPDKSFLTVIDVQGKLAHSVFEKSIVFKHIQALIKLANALSVPILLTEQAPEKIGVTIHEILDALPGIKPIVKQSFSCCFEEDYPQTIKSLKRKQAIICGIETHVCVFQTVSDLLKMKYEVQVVVDAVSSRSEFNKMVALNRMEQEGAVLTSVEMLATELLRTSAHKKFKEVLQLIR